VELPATVLNSLQEVVRAGGAIGIPGLYVTGDPGGVDEAAKVGSLSIRIGLGWRNRVLSTPGSARFSATTGSSCRLFCTTRHNRQACNVTIISLNEAPQGYQDFDRGAAKKFVIDPHKSLAA